MISLFAGVLALSAMMHKPQQSASSVTFTFFGCNRIDAKDVERTRNENPSTANIPQLRANLESINRINPEFAFFGGDIVLGYADDDGETLKTELNAWKAVVAKSMPIPQTQLVLVAGNHEVNRKSGERKLPNAKTIAVWNRFIRSSGMIPRHITSGPNGRNHLDSQVREDESLLNYSFDKDFVHFVVLNTDTRVLRIDPKTGEGIIAAIPYEWLEKDIRKAQSSHHIKTIVILGHRNLIDDVTVKGDAPIEPESAAKLMEIIKRNDKVLAYVCAHVHAMAVTTFPDSEAVQALFGNGGSKLEAGWKPAGGRTFGFGSFTANNDGTLTITPYVRPEPRNYLADTIVDVPEAVPLTTICVKPRRAR